MSRRIALIEDDDSFREALAERLSLAEFEVVAFASAETALKALRPDFDGVVVSDLRMPGMDGRQLAERLSRLDPDLPVVLMTGHGDVADAVEAMKRGAYDFLTKPFASERLIETLGRALEKRALILDNRRLAALAAETEDSVPLSGEGAASAALRAAVRELASAEVDVLIEGETGSGKEAVARAIHAASRRRHRSFVAVSCAALPVEDAEARLMGQEASVGSGLLRRREGRIEQSHQGTLFLDEVDLAPEAVQRMLLRVLEEREVLPLGAAEPRAVDLRVLAASNGDPAHAVASGRLREDLFWRLNVVRLRVPPLRERREDVPILFARFLSRAAARLDRPMPSIDDVVRRRLLDHDWPGNLRELSNYANAVALGLKTIGSESSGDHPGLADRVARYEAELIREALSIHGGDIRRVTDVLRIPRKTLYDKMARLGIRPSEHRPGRGGTHRPAREDEGTPPPHR